MPPRLLLCYVHTIHTHITTCCLIAITHTTCTQQPAKALETARTANRRLREEIKATAEELAATKAQQGENARRHSQSLVAAKSALDEVGVRHSESKRVPPPKILRFVFALLLLLLPLLRASFGVYIPLAYDSMQRGQGVGELAN